MSEMKARGSPGPHTFDPEKLLKRDSDGVCGDNPVRILPPIEGAASPVIFLM